MKLDRNILEEYLDGELNAAERAQVETQLQADVGASRLVARLRQEQALRSAALRTYEPQPSEAAVLANQLLSHIDETAGAPLAKIGGPQGHFWFRRLSAVAAALVLVAGSFYAGRSSSQLSGGMTYRVVTPTLDGHVVTTEFSTYEEATDFAQKQAQNAVASTADETGVF